VTLYFELQVIGWSEIVFLLFGFQESDAAWSSTAREVKTFKSSTRVDNTGARDISPGQRTRNAGGVVVSRMGAGGGRRDRSSNLGVCVQTPSEMHTKISLSKSCASRCKSPHPPKAY